MDIFEAIKTGNIVKIKEFLADNFDPNAATSDGLKVLHVGAMSDNMEVLELLLKQHNIQISVQDVDGNTPLHIAAKHNNFEAVKTLIGFGATPSTTSHTGKKPIDMTQNEEIKNFLNEKMSASANGRNIQQARIEFLKSMEQKLPSDIPTLKSFAIEFLLANQLFQERCKDTIYQIVTDKHEAMYRRRKLELKAGINDTETGATFLNNLQKIEEENETQVATIARLKIQNHMLESNANSKSDAFRKNFCEASEQSEEQCVKSSNELATTENEFMSRVTKKIQHAMELRTRIANKTLESLQSKGSTMRAADLQFLQSVQNENIYLQKNITELKAQTVALSQRLKNIELLKSIYEKDVNKIRNDTILLKKAIHETMAKAFYEARTEADDKQEETGQIQFSRIEGGRKVVKAATLEKLLDRLTDPSTFDSQYQSTFLLTFRSFTSAQVVLTYIVKRYKDSMVTNTTNPSSQSASNPARLRICQTVKDWIELCFFDFEDDSTLMGKLNDFLDYTTRTSPKNANIIRTALSRKQNEKESPSAEKKESSAPKPIVPKNIAKRMEMEENAAREGRADRAASISTWSGFNFGKTRTGEKLDFELKFTDIDPVEFARQLTLIEYQIFTAIRPTEFLDQAWVKDDKDEKAPNITEMTKWSYHVTQWIVSEIITVKDMKTRAAVFERVVMIAYNLRQINNFNGAKEVLNALQSQVVKNLTRTRELVPPKTIKILDDLEKLSGPSMNYKLLRGEIHKSQLPMIPYPGIYQHDLSSIDTASKNILPNKMINFSKYHKLATYILELQVYQQTPYNFIFVLEIQDYIRTYDTINENEAIRVASILEPK